MPGSNNWRLKTFTEPFMLVSWGRYAVIIHVHPLTSAALESNQSIEVLKRGIEVESKRADPNLQHPLLDSVINH